MDGMKKSKLTLNADFRVAKVDPRIYGSFIEHLGRAVYGGIYEPGHPTADGNGFRGDVAELVRESGATVVRYPGGNFVSGYNWEDGVGPVEKRPKRLELAWNSVEPNTFGTDEFIKWCRATGTEPMMAVNLGTRSDAEAQALVEYCNHASGTYWSDLRIANGARDPHGVKLWCLGNEMDGPWQIGHSDARAYGLKANSASRMMKMTDDSIETVLCGSSNMWMRTFGEWEAQTLDIAYDTVDYVSMHSYFDNRPGDLADFLAKTTEMDDFINGVVAVCDYIKAKKHSKKTVNLSFDEWNVWYHSNGTKVDKWIQAPPILEDVYDFADAVEVGLLMIALLRHCDRVKIACLAQLVNVIAPIMTETGGRSWRQTIFYPFAQAAKYGRGSVLLGLLETGRHDTSHHGGVPDVDAVAVLSDDGEELTLFAVNRGLDADDPELLEVELQKLPGMRPVEHLSMFGFAPDAVNTADSQPVAPALMPVPFFKDGAAKAVLPAMSWNVIRFKKTDGNG